MDPHEDQNSCHKGWYSRGYLPHLDSAGVIQSVTFRLADSMPASRLEQWKTEAKTIGYPRLVLQRAADWLDAGHGACHLTDARVAAVVEKTLLYFDQEKYRMLAWVIMPNHVHVLAEILNDGRLPDIVRTWKAFSARKANEILGRRGRFWQADYFDRFIRDDTHLAKAKRYIHQNPVKAGLVDYPEAWPFSSANPKWGR